MAWPGAAVRRTGLGGAASTGQGRGQAAAAAVADKKSRYGMEVLPVVFETYGRAALETTRSLELIAAHAGCCVRDAWARVLRRERWDATAAGAPETPCRVGASGTA